MAAPIRFLSGRQQQQKIGIEGSTDNQKVLEVVGQVGIGTTVFEPSVQLEVRGDASVSGVLTAGSLNAGSLSLTGSGGALTVGTLNATGVSTFGGAVDVNAGLDVDGQSDLDEVVVAGVATFSNAVDINSTLDVDGDTQLDDLNVAGVSTFSSAVNATAAVNATDIIKGYKYTAVPYGSTVTLAVTVASKDSTHRYNGTGSGNGYVIDGIQAPFLTLTPGRTYRFTNDNTGSHPLKFYLEADKTTLYETNVNFQDAYTEITVTDQTPIVLHYQCTAHGYMGNAVQTNANVVNTNYPATIRSTLDVTGVSTFPQLDVSTGGLDVDGLTNLDEVVVAGVSTFTGNIVAVSAEFSGNVTIAGTLTAEDKTNIDSLGIVTARTGVRIDTGGLIVTAGVSTFTDSVDINNGVGVVGGLTADSLTISGVTTGINAAGISSFVRIDVDGQADLDELVVAGVATFQGAVNFDVNSEVNIGTGVTILGDNLHVTGIISAAQFIGDGSGLTNLPGISTIGSSSLTDVNVSGTTTTAQLRVSGVGTAEKFFVSTGGFDVDGQSDLDELVVAGVSTFSANTFINADLSVTGDIGASGIITATGIQLVAGSGLDVGAVGVLTALSVDVSTGGIDVDGQATLDELVVAGVSTFTGTVKIDGALDIGVAGVDVEGLTNLDELIVAGVSTFTGAVDINAGLDVDGQTDLDELQVAGVSTFSAKAVFNTAYPSIDADNEIQVGTAIQLGKAGVITATSFSGSGANLTGIGTQATNVQAQSLTVAGISTFNDDVRILAGGLNVTGVSTFSSDISIADKIVHTGDTNTAIRFPAADTFTVETGGSERVRITSAGNVGIDSTVPSEKLDVAGSIKSTGTINNLTVGRGAGNKSTNTALGFQALNANTSGTSNVAGGYQSLLNNDSGLNNTGFGYGSLKSNTSGDYNIGLGLFSAQNIETGNNNVALGANALNDLVSGSSNVAIGYYAGRYLTGSNNTILGAYQGTASETSISDTVIISAGTAERLRINSAGLVGIGITNPTSKLDVVGDAKVTGVITATTFVGNVTGTASNASGATGDFSIADKIVHTGDTDTAIRFPAANTFSVETAGSERLRVRNNGVVAIGTDESTTINFSAAQTQIFGTVGDRALSLMYTQANASGPQLNFAKGRDLDNSASTAVSSGDLLGSLHFAGADGSDFNSVGAEIVVKVDGTPGSNDMPGRIEFKTTADGESTTTERLRIDSAGRMSLGGTPPTGYGAGRVSLDIHSSGATVSHLALTNSTTGTDGSSNGFNIVQNGLNTLLFLRESGFMSFSTAGTEAARITSAGNFNFLGSLVNVNATGVSSFVQLDVSTGGLDVDGQTDLDELQVAGVSTFSAKAIFNTAYPSIDADNEIQVGTAIQLGKAGVVTATTFVGNLTGTASAASGLSTTISINTSGIITATSFVGDGSALTGIAAGGSGEFNTGISSSRQIVPLSFESTVFTFPSTAGKQYVIESINVANVDESVGVGTTVNIIASIQDATAGEQTYIAYNVPIVTGGLIELLKNPIVAGPSDVIRMWSTNDAYAGVGNAADVYMNFTEHSDSTDFISKFASTASVTSTDTTTLYTSTSNPTVIEKIGLANRTDIGDFPISIKITNGTSTSYLAKDLIIPRYSTVDILDRQKRIETGAKIEVEVGSTSTIDIIIAGKKITS